MDDFHEQRICVKMCFKLGKSFSETFEMLKQAFEDEAMGRTQSHKWYIRFKEGRTSTNDNERSGRSSTSKNEENIQKVRKVIRSNCRLTIREVAEEAGILKATCHEILALAVGTATICTPKEHLVLHLIPKGLHHHANYQQLSVHHYTIPELPKTYC